MTWLELWIQTPLAKALAWTLLHSLWEGAAAALLLTAAVCVLRSPRARYVAACVALLALLAGFTITLARLWPAGAAPAASHVAPLPGPPQIDMTASDATAPHAFHAADLLPWLAPFWMLGVLAFHLRALAGWITARRLRRSGVCCAAADWTARLERLAMRIRISRPVTLFESCLAEAPVVIGHLRPVILMPVGLLTGLPVAQVESILAHELAHIRRQDYLVNLMQTFVEGLLFYHPAVWWISRVIRAERENCCDDIAVAVSGDARQYAAALAALEQNRFAAHELALAATGGSLVNRIRRHSRNSRALARWLCSARVGNCFDSRHRRRIGRLADHAGAEAASVRRSGCEPGCPGGLSRTGGILDARRGRADPSAASAGHTDRRRSRAAAAAANSAGAAGGTGRSVDALQEVAQRGRRLHHHRRGTGGVQSL